jgi:CubicO group peptidase (beta-lactamase class C family)
MVDTDVQHRVLRTMGDLVAGGAETGVQVAVIKDGRTVIDVCVGATDADGERPVTADTLFFAASTAKGVAAAIAHVLVERGAIAYDTRVAEVWPEFGAHGKDQVTLRDVLLHTAGVPGLPPDTTVDDLCDWERMCRLLAEATPWWEPGTQTGYHAQTFGFLLGETLRRATGRNLSTLLRDELTRPLGVADEVHFAVPERLLPRVAHQVPGPAPAPPEPGSPLARAIPPGVMATAEVANRTDFLTAEIPANGTMSARGVARLYAALLGHLPGITLVPAARRALMAAPAFSGIDQVMGFPTTWAFGYSPNRPGAVPSRPGSTFGMVGSNGSAAYADIDTGVAVAVMHNRFTAGDLTAVTIVDRIVADSFPA